MRTKTTAVIALLGAAVIAFAAKTSAPGFSADRYISHIKFLASPEMRGRESGSPELEKAAQYIAAQFKADGLKPLEGKNYLQAFEVTTSAKLGSANRFDFTVSSDQPVAEKRSLQPGKEFIPFNFSSRGAASGGS